MAPLDLTVWRSIRPIGKGMKNKQFSSRAGVLSQGEAYSAAAIVEWEPSLSEVALDGASREVCDLSMNIWP